MSKAALMRPSWEIEQTMHVYGDAVWRACLVYLAPTETEDVFQETFMKYALHDAEFHDEGHKKAWLLRVSINICKDILKSKQRKNESLESRMERGEVFPGETVSDGQTSTGTSLREILDALDSLGDPPKTELYLSLYEGYTAREIAEMTGEPEGTVYSWISRGKKQLQEVLR